ncbi:MAG: S1 family peptidase [Acidimicrobiales bacterium]
MSTSLRSRRKNASKAAKAGTSSNKGETSGKSEAPGQANKTGDGQRSGFGPTGIAGAKSISKSSLRSGSSEERARVAADASGRFGNWRFGLGSRRRVGGVAPFVPPKNRLGRRMRMREWSQRGFVQLSPQKQKLRHRILPRTVIGIAFMLLSAGVGAAFSGAAFYAYYDNRLAENERTVARFVEGFDQQFTDASGALNEMQTEAVATIRSELAPLDSYVTDARGVITLPATAGPSVWLVETRDEGGRLVNGSAFAAVGHRGGTALVTSLDLVLSSTNAPNPGIDLIKGNERIPATLWAWDEDRDLALLVVDRQIPVLEIAGDKAQVDAVGGRIFALSGFGGQGATASPGVLLDHSQLGLQHTAPVGTLFMGGPLLDGQGRVVGMASGAYRPFGVDPGDVRQAPDVSGICAKILRCSEVDEGLTAETIDG